MRLLGIDIGGANIKAAVRTSHKIEQARSWSFALWKDPAGLPEKLREVFEQVGPVDVIGATMTGELCDCFGSKGEGVRAIVDALDALKDGANLRWWSTEGRFVGSETAKDQFLSIAAANWSAGSHWLGRKYSEGLALWIDIGSTTTDIIPILDGKPIPLGITDPQRIQSGELVYTGVRRTPLCALMGLNGATEFFATTDDLFGILGDMPEYSNDCDTADGKPRTQIARRLRMARMLGGDLGTTSEDEIVGLTHSLRKVMVDRIANSIETIQSRVGREIGRFLVSGSGEFFARQIHQEIRGDSSPRVDLSKLLGKAASTALPAVALAMLLEVQGC